MSGETNLEQLLKQMNPSLSPDEFVFCTLPSGGYGDLKELMPIGSFQEAEGLTLILRKEDADSEGLEYNGIFQKITLEVHSSLDAVGLTAAISTLLAEHNISANVFAAYFHDHVFVPREKSHQALAALTALSQK